MKKKCGWTVGVEVEGGGRGEDAYRFRGSVRAGMVG